GSNNDTGDPNSGEQTNVHGAPSTAQGCRSLMVRTREQPLERILQRLAQRPRFPTEFPACEAGVIPGVAAPELKDGARDLGRFPAQLTPHLVRRDKGIDHPGLDGEQQGRRSKSPDGGNLSEELVRHDILAAQEIALAVTALL